jgi:hypothetical protein
LGEQIQRRQAEQTAARAADASTLKQAENEVSRARLAVATNRILPTIEAEKNDLTLDQALARLAQLSNTFASAWLEAACCNASNSITDISSGNGRRP